MRGTVELIITKNKYPSIKIDGQFYSSTLDFSNKPFKPMHDLTQFHQGDEVEYDIVQNGDFKNITEIRKVGDMEEPQPNYQDYSRETEVRTVSSNGNGNSHVNIDALRIYVTGVVGRGMSSGKFSISDVEPLTAEAVRSFKKHLG
tara:strand:- start:38 stop:472 length:435 start_codon:yes stop_codon:yes gene_type:complete